MAGNKEYSVNWKAHMSYCKKAFHHLWSSSEFVDVTLYCEGKKIQAHKMLLSACSTYFHDIFKDVPCQHPTIILNGVEFQILNNIIQFIYNGEVSVDTNKLDTFLKTAQLLKISGLTEAAANLENEEPKSTENTTREIIPRENVTEPQIENQPSASEEPPAKKIKETAQVHEKSSKPDNEQIAIPDIKCEPTEMIIFDEPVEDPLQPDQSIRPPPEYPALQTFGDDDIKYVPDMIGEQEQGEPVNQQSISKNACKKFEENVKKNSFWRIIYQDTGIDLPTYLKNVLSLTGFDSAVTFGRLSDHEIKKIELFAQNDMVKIVDEQCKKNFFDIYTHNPKMFQIKPAHKTLLIEIKKYVGSKNLKYFTDYKSQENALLVSRPSDEETKENLIQEVKQLYDLVKGWYMRQREKDVFTPFFEQPPSTYISVKVRDMDDGTFTYVADLTCIICQLKLKAHKIVYGKVVMGKPRRMRWIFRNFTNHVDKHFKLNKSQVSILVEECSVDSKPNTSELQSLCIDDDDSDMFEGNSQ